MASNPPVELRLPLRQAETLHAALEDLLENGDADPDLQRSYRLLGWRILAAKDATGLTGRIAALARESQTLEQYEAARDHELGPILEGLEGGENRDP